MCDKKQLSSILLSKVLRRVVSGSGTSVGSLEAQEALVEPAFRWGRGSGLGYQCSTLELRLEVAYTPALSHKVWMGGDFFA